MTAVAALVAAVSMADIKWVGSHAAAVKQAKASKKLVMIEFYAKWDLDGNRSAAWSGRMENDTFAQPAVQKTIAKFVPVRLDVEKEGKALAQKYTVTKYPTILFLDANGADMGRIDGYEQADEFNKHAETFLKDYNREAGLRAKLAKSPRDLDTITALGVMEANRYKVAPAIAFLRKAEAIDPVNKTGKLSDLYSAIADIHQNASQYDQAIAFFKKSADTSTKTTPKAYALLSIATCYMSKEGDLDPNASLNMKTRRDNAIKNFKLALPYVQQTLKLPGLSKEDRQIAESDLEQINEVLNSGDPDGN